MHCLILIVSSTYVHCDENKLKKELLKMQMMQENNNAPLELNITNRLALYSCAHSKELFYYSTLLFDGNQAKSMLK